MPTPLQVGVRTTRPCFHCDGLTSTARRTPPRLTVLLAAALLVSASGSYGKEDDTSSRCAWAPPQRSRTVAVRTESELVQAVRSSGPQTAILLEDGDYALQGTLELRSADMVLASRSGDASKVVLHGDGMVDGRVRVALSVIAPRVTIANLTIRDVTAHGVQVRGEVGASGVALHGLHIVDTGQQLVKGSTGKGPLHADGGILACSTLEYTDHAPSSYTNGIDVLAGKGWVVRDNRFLRIRGPGRERWRAGPAILFWANSIGTVVERNVIIDCYRAVALGLGPAASPLARDGEAVYDHQGGLIGGNVITNYNDWADEGIEVNSARDVIVQDNLVDIVGHLPWSISLRFPMTKTFVRRNRTSGSIVRRDRASAEISENTRLPVGPK